MKESKESSAYSETLEDVMTNDSGKHYYVEESFTTETRIYLLYIYTPFDIIRILLVSPYIN